MINFIKSQKEATLWIALLLFFGTLLTVLSSCGVIAE